VWLQSLLSIRFSCRVLSAKGLQSISGVSSHCVRVSGVSEVDSEAIPVCAESGKLPAKRRWEFGVLDQQLS
jgi:hypothetical protein